MLLSPDAPVGADFAQWYGMADTVLDLEITPNRPDCLSMRGIAREFGAVLDSPPAPLPTADITEQGASIDSAATVSITEPALCPRYAARLIRNVKIGPSPQWLAQRVIAAGARPINNVVDITNLVMFETGQPLHAFDYDRIAKDASGRAAIIVRRATEGETITTLDDVERRLNPSNLLITDPSGPITLAGVMGAENTEVTDNTTTIFLEGAIFDSATTSRTSRGFALISEASLRYERGVDIEYTPTAIDRAAALMAQLAAGQVAPGMIDEYPRPYERPTLTLRESAVQRLIGEPIPIDVCAASLTKLDLEVSTSTPGTLAVVIPAFRPDLLREVDLIEEVLRLWGMERISPTLPTGNGHAGGLTSAQQLTRRVAATLRAAGLNETITLPFGNPRDYAALGMASGDGAELVELHNPMSADQSVLRSLLVPNLLSAVSLNLRQGTKDVQLFEIGDVFTTADGRKQPKEVQRVGAVLAGSFNPPGWNDPAVPLDFYDGKGIIELLVRELCVGRYRLVAAADGAWPFLQPGRSADIVMAGQTVGWLGEVHPRVLRFFAIDEPVTAFEFNLSAFLKAAQASRPFASPSRYPSIDFDVALVVDESVEAETLLQRIRTLGKKTPLFAVRLFDVYRGTGITPGKKSLAFSFSYRSTDRTLTAAEVEGVHHNLIEKLCKATEATIRA
jgi:phenylalanyl-tRNA synthetase beta chain